jgi:hypothetical protein
MAEAGFTLEAMLRFNRSSRPAWWLSGKVFYQRKISRFQLKNFDRMAPLLRHIDPWLPWGPTSIIAVGRKNP